MIIMIRKICGYTLHMFVHFCNHVYNCTMYTVNFRVYSIHVIIVYST